MKSLFFVLALNVFLSAADTVQNASNASDLSKVGSRKIKHTISRIFRVPHNTVRQSVDKINSASYNELIDILTNKVSKKQDIETSESSAEYRNINDLNTENLDHSYEDVPAQSKVYSQDKNSDEFIDNFDTLNETKSKLYSIILNENGTVKSVTDGNISTKETELNADVLSEIIQNLKDSNVSSFGNKQNKIRKGKLVIYYDENDEHSKNPVEISTKIEKNYESEIQRAKKIEAEILSLYIQYNVPQRIYYAIQNQAYVNEEERIKDLITTFVKYIVDKKQLQLEMINKLKLLIAENNIDLDLIKLLITSWNKLDGIDLNTETQIINTAYNEIESILGNSDNIIQEKDNENPNETTTILNIPIIKQIDHVLNNNKVNDTVENLLINPKNSINPAINPNSSSILRDILFQHTKGDIQMINENIIEGLLSEMNTDVFDSKDSEVNTNNDNFVKVLPNSKDNIFEVKTSRSNVSEDTTGSFLEKVNNSDKTRDISHDHKNSQMIKLLKNAIITDIVLNNRKRLKEDIVNQIISQVKDKSSIKNPHLELSCDDNWSCDLGKYNNDNVHTLDTDTFNFLLNGALRDIVPQLYQVDSDVSASSNLPVHKYLKYNKGKPFLIYVIPPEVGKKRPVFISDWVNKHSRKPIEKDQRPNVYHKDDDENRVFIKLFSQPYYPEESDQYDILNLIKNIVTQKHNRKQPEYDNYNIIKEIIQKFPDNNIPNNIPNIINTPQNHFYENDENFEDYPKVPKILNDLPNLYNDNNNIFYPQIQTDLLNHSEPPQSNQDDAINRIIDEFIHLYPNIDTDAIQELSNNIIPKNTAEYGSESGSLRSSTEDPNSLNLLLKLITNDAINKGGSKRIILTTTEDKTIDQLTDGLIKQILHMQKILEMKNIPQSIMREIIEKEARKGIFEITKKSISTCTSRVNRIIELGINNALRRYMLQ